MGLFQYKDANIFMIQISKPKKMFSCIEMDVWSFSSLRYCPDDILDIFFRIKNFVFWIKWYQSFLLRTQFTISSLVKVMAWYWTEGGAAWTHDGPGGISKTHTSSWICELLNFQHYIKIISFNVWVKYFVRNFKDTLWNSTQNILPIHRKMCSLFRSKDLTAPSFTSS